jgi:Family of unknown function (DUF5519)
MSITTNTAGASARITAEVTSWPGVEAGIGERGEYGFRVGRRQIGHLHGDHAAHFGFPRQLWEQLIAEGRVGPHPIDHPGWAARRIRDDHDVDEVIALLRMNYDRVIARHGLPGAA